mmetsp:Transcript_46918/g.152499  ORF Transcript_46918/g.152499 Transcript_46918/m.152499 type:complete len:349 (-) Transcript_46918:144-1190(-)
MNRGGAKGEAHRRRLPAPDPHRFGSVTREPWAAPSRDDRGLPHSSRDPRHNDGCVVERVNIGSMAAAAKRSALAQARGSSAGSQGGGKRRLNEDARQPDFANRTHAPAGAAEPLWQTMAKTGSEAAWRSDYHPPRPPISRMPDARQPDGLPAGHRGEESRHPPAADLPSSRPDLAADWRPKVRKLTPGTLVFEVPARYISRTAVREEGLPLLITGRDISRMAVRGPAGVRGESSPVDVRVAPFEPQAVDLHFPEHEFSLHRNHLAPFVAGFRHAWEKAHTNDVFTTHARQERLLGAVEYMEDFHARQCSGGRSEGRSPTVEVLWRRAMGEAPLPERLARYSADRRGGQ